MESSPYPAAHLVLTTKETQNRSGLFSTEAVLNILRLIFAGAPLAQVLTIIAQLVESRDDGNCCGCDICGQECSIGSIVFAAGGL